MFYCRYSHLMIFFSLSSNTFLLYGMHWLTHVDHGLFLFHDMLIILSSLCNNVLLAHHCCPLMLITIILLKLMVFFVFKCFLLH